MSTDASQIKTEPPGRPPTGPPPPGGPDELSELRYLLLGPERRQLAEIQHQIEHLGAVSVEDVAAVLPQAVMTSARTNRQLHEALLPVIEEDIGLSAKRNPRTLADVLFPVMGPAIRKAIREAISGMIDSLNDTLEHSVSPRGVQWRLEAMRSGKSFAEVVFLHTMLYRVEQVFLIHRDTGLLLQHAATPMAERTGKEPDVVSGMLTAIQDFVRESFVTKDAESLETLKMGDVTIWIERGPIATVAGIVRGHAPHDLRQIFQEALGEIHREQLDALRSFDGDSSEFTMARPHLEGCLQFQVNPKEQAREAQKKVSPAFVLGAILLALLGVWAVFHFRAEWRWNGYLDRLAREPGLIITEARSGWTSYQVDGLRDPLAADPAALIKDTNLDPDDVVSRWRPYQSLDSRFVLQRAQRLLAPPATVSLKMTADGTLAASGVAARSWIDHARTVAPALSGVSAYDDEQVVDAEWQEVIKLRDQAQTINVQFPEGGDRPQAAMNAQIDALAATLRRLVDLAASTRRHLSLEIIGHTDGSGAEALNRQLSVRRAERLRAALQARLPAGVPMTVRGVSSAEPLRREVSPDDRPFNRRATVRVTVAAAPEIASR